MADESASGARGEGLNGDDREIPAARKCDAISAVEMAEHVGIANFGLFLSKRDGHPRTAGLLSPTLSSVLGARELKCPQCRRVNNSINAHTPIMQVLLAQGAPTHAACFPSCNDARAPQYMMVQRPGPCGSYTCDAARVVTMYVL